MILWTLEEAQALAPDSASLKAAEKLLNPAKWQGLSEAENTLWGQCKGSGAKPYDVQLDTRQRRGACTCPSRKQPCKHVVALAQMGVNARMLFTPGELPAQIQQWLDRVQKTQRSNHPKTEVQPQQQRLTPAEKQAQQADYDQKRFAAIKQGILECERWLTDVLREGLAELSHNTLQGFDYMAARLVDTQAPALGRKLKKLGQLLKSRTHSDWPARAAEFLGQIFLILQAYHRYDSLHPLLQIDLKNQLGWPQRQKDYEDQEANWESWWVIAQIEQGEIDLRVRRTWVYGLESQRLGLLLDYSFRNQGFEKKYQLGEVYRAQAIFFPSSVPLRLFFKTTHETGPLAVTDALKNSQIPRELLTKDQTLKQCLYEWSQALGKNPWVEQWPFFFSGATLYQSQDQFYLRDTSGDCMAVNLTESAYWQARALSGGQDCTVFAEWNGREFILLSLFSEAGFAVLEPQPGAFPDLPELPEVLLKPLLMGQGRQPWQGQVPDALKQAGSAQITNFQTLLSYHALTHRAACKIPGQDVVVDAVEPGAGFESVESQKFRPLQGFNAELWQAIFAQDPINVKAILLEYLAHQYSLPALILPQALDWFCEYPTLLEPQQIQQLLDQRGLWLAQQHPRWQAFQMQKDADLRQDLLAYPELFRTWQIQDETQALQSLRAVWPKLSTAQRIAFIKHILATPLSEPFLEACLDERQPVREAAAKCLAQNQDSQLIKRMSQRASALLRIYPDRLEVTLPKTGAMQLAWGRDGLNIPGRQLSGDERKAMLFDLFSCLPLKFWQFHLPRASAFEIWTLIWQGKNLPLMASFLYSCLLQARRPQIQELLISILQAHFQGVCPLPNLPRMSKRQLSEINLNALFGALSPRSQSHFMASLQSLQPSGLSDDLAELMRGLCAPLEEKSGQWLAELYVQRCQHLLWQVQDRQIPPQPLTDAQHLQFARCCPHGLLDTYQRNLRELSEWFDAFLFDPGSWGAKGLSPQDLQSIRGSQSPAKKTQAAILVNLQIMHKRSSLRKELFS